jgi:hypothetical protein
VGGAAAELARPGVAPGAHLRVVSEPGPAAHAGARPAARPRLRGRLVGKIPAEDIHGGRIELTQPPPCLPQPPDQRRRSVAYRSMVQVQVLDMV